jgi:LacI family transcriptional regulator
MYRLPASLKVLHALAQFRIPVPQQVAVVAFDDFELADILQPALTVVRQPIHKIGQEAAELLFSRLLNGAGIEGQRKVTLPVELVVRNSCGCTFSLAPASI